MTIRVNENEQVNVEWKHMEVKALVQELPYVQRAQKKSVETYEALPQWNFSRVLDRQLEFDFLHLIF
jgi:hypothetical protein